MTRIPFEDRLEFLLDELFGRKDIFSAVMGVSSGNGDLRWISARGEASPGGRPMTAETPFFIASVTKLYLAVIVMRMVEEGELALGDRMVDRLPASLTRGIHVQGGTDFTDRITLEHLLAHASGLPDFIEDYPARGTGVEDRRSLVEILLVEGDRNWSLEDTARRVREDLQPHFPPQELAAKKVRIRYSDTNYQLLRGIIQEVRGSSFAEALSELVLEPLGLHRTWVPGDERADRPEVPVAALHSGDELVRFPSFFSSIADLEGTADDLLRFLEALTRGELFRDPRTWPRMQARWNRFSQPLDRAALRQPSWPIEYGLGVMRFQLPRFLTPFRPIPPVVGHTGSTGVWLFHAPELDLHLVGALSQITAGPVPFRFVPKVLRAALETRHEAPAG